MGKIDIYAVAGFSDKVAKIYFCDGLIFYLTSNKSVILALVVGYLKKDSDKNVNNVDDDAFLTYIQVAKEDFFIEHNEEFNINEANTLVGIMTS
ncbi:hypothetical protein ACFQ9Y_21515 [Peribacillus simplex]|uniref:hypothetical protein n=1 Tax=Peribacillus simplex TaxID=1478 RepID=UPI00366B6388